jgi:hypothetical protein
MATLRWALLKSQPAGDFDSLGIHPAILVREKSGDHRPDVVRHSGAPQRRHCRDHFIDFGIARGVLVEVLPRYRPEPMSLSLLYAHRRNLPKRVRVFMDWVAEILRPVLAH